MRLSNKCDEMNLTGCTELHNWEATGTGINHFLYVYQVEVALISSIAIILLLFYFIGKKIRKDVNQAKSETKQDGGEQ